MITGERGFIGSHLVQYLQKLDFEIVFFNRDISDRKNFETFETDKKISAVIHLAAAVNKRSSEAFKKTNVEGTKNIIELCKHIQAERLIFLSSIRALSSRSDPYIDSKKEAEKIIRDSGLPHIILRPSIVYGPGDKKNLTLLVKRLKQLPFWPVFKFRMQPLYIGDLVQVIHKSLDLPPNSILKITGKEVISYTDLLDYMAELGYKRARINSPSFFNFLIKAMSRLPFSPFPRWQVETLFADEIYEGDQWSEKFNIKPTLFCEGIRQIV